MRVVSIAKYRSSWIRRTALLYFLGIGLLFSFSFLLVDSLELEKTWLLVPVFASLVILLSAYRALPTSRDALDHLHLTVPELEHSLGIYEKPIDQLNDLEKLQKTRIDAVLDVKTVKLPSPNFHLKVILGGFIVTLMSFYLGSFLRSDLDEVNTFPTQEIEVKENIDIKKDSAYLSKMTLRVQPLEYTAMKGYSSSKLDAQVPEGSFLSWSFVENGPIDKVSFLFNDEAETSVKSRKMKKSALYYYSVVDTSGRKVNSPYYNISVVEDQKPTVVVEGIEEYQKLPWKDNYDLDFRISISDDYGIQDGFISATVAKGQGESVKFREKTFPLRNLGNSEFTFSTKEFDMEPGSELYFYVMAKDNCPFRVQATKSSTFFIVLEDTVSYDYVEESGMQVDLMPEFFRSQRQIIIDTEKLISEKREISAREFKQRSNELGYEQKLLRLKYGQFLGEEAESGIALENEIETEEHDHDHDHDHGEGEHVEFNPLEEYGHNHDHEGEAGELLAEKGTRNEDPSRPDWVKELSHSHDNADENTYFEISLKGKLKAALSVMWDAELHLRLYNPQESLPFQYEALEYLQEIKNHARIYVHRIGFDPPAIKVAEKRLSGKLDDVVAARNEREVDYSTNFDEIASAIEHFSKKQIGNNYELDVSDYSILEAAGREMSSLALEQLNLLSCLALIREVVNEGRLSKEGLLDILAGMQKALPKENNKINQREIRIHPVSRSAIEAL